MWSAAPASDVIDTLEAFDLSILRFLVAQRTDELTAVTLTIGRLGTQSSVMGLVALAGLLIVLARRSWRTGMAVALSVILAQVLVGLLKDVLQRPRPPLDVTLLAGLGYAFPSTHAAFTSAGVAAYVAAGWVGRRGDTPGRRHPGLVAILVALVAFVGFSMVYLGSHWAGDVLAGWLIGPPLGWAVGRALRDPTRRTSRDAPRPPGHQTRGPQAVHRGGGGGI